MKWISALKDAAHGLIASESAEKSGVSKRAVEAKLSRARAKMRAKTTAEAVYKAVKAGLICLVPALPVEVLQVAVSLAV